MFKHILFPTDGAATSRHVIRECVSFARDAGAVITALHVMPRYSPYAYQAEIVGESLEEFRRECVAAAEEFLAEITVVAREAGVPCTPLHITSDYPYDAIIRTAEEKHCDLIVMASHGRHGISALVLGSETVKVLAHCKIPVLVHR